MNVNGYHTDRMKNRHQPAGKAGPKPPPNGRPVAMKPRGIVHLHPYTPESEYGQILLKHGATVRYGHVATVTPIAEVRPLTLPERVRLAAQRIARRLMP